MVIVVESKDKKNIIMVVGLWYMFGVLLFELLKHKDARFRNE